MEEKPAEKPLFEKDDYWGMPQGSLDAALGTETSVTKKAILEL